MSILQARRYFTGAGQLKFPATQNPSTDANTLDDYEEGTFTPTIAFGGSSSGVTYSVQTGGYIKIGKTVFIRINLTLTSNGSGTGSASIGGLPFTSGSVPGNFAFTYWAGMSGIVGNMMGNVNSSATTINLFHSGAAAAASLTDTNITDTADMYLGGVYQASA